MARTLAIVQGREAFARQRWREAYAQLSAAERETPLEPADLERLATAAYLVGEDAHATTIWTRAHQKHIDQGNVERAARRGVRDRRSGVKGKSVSVVVELGGGRSI